MLVYYSASVFKGESVLLPRPLEVDEVEHIEVTPDYQVAVSQLEGNGFIYTIDTDNLYTPIQIKETFKLDTPLYWLTESVTGTLKDIYVNNTISKNIPTLKTMPFKTFLLNALSANKHEIRTWVMDAFSLKRDYPRRATWDVFPDEVNGKYATHNEQGEKVLIDTTNLDYPCVGFWRAITLNKGDLPNITETTKTTTGEVFSNYVLFIAHFGALVPYFTGVITPGLVNDVYVELRKKGQLTDVSKLLHALTVGESLATYCNIGAAGESPKSYVTAPGLRKRRDELLATIDLNATDQSKLAEVTGELISLNKDWSKGDEVERFNDATGKIQNIVNVKTQIMIGTEDAIGGGRTKVVATSLEEGIRIDDLPSTVSGMRAGSEARGKNTAFGGVGIKMTQRALAVYRVGALLDCGTKLGYTKQITQFSYKDIIGRYALNSKKPFSSSEAKSYIGKTIVIRDPAYCLTSLKSFEPCRTCLGINASQRVGAIALEASNINSIFQGAMMSAAHGKALTVQEVTLSEVAS